MLSQNSSPSWGKVDTFMHITIVRQTPRGDFYASVMVLKVDGCTCYPQRGLACRNFQTTGSIHQLLSSRLLVCSKVQWGSMIAFYSSDGSHKDAPAQVQDVSMFGKIWLKKFNGRFPGG